MITLDRCALCPGVNACLPPDGPEDADILFIGEAPGKQENQKGRVFIGRTGDEVTKHYLPLAGLRRDRVLFTNTLRCLPDTAGGKLDPKNKQHLALAECCSAHHLYPLIARMGPKLLVPLGAFACRAIGIEGDLEHEHGLPQSGPWGMAFPMYHPALGLYEPKKMLQLRNDWIKLKAFLKGAPIRFVDQWAGHEDYREVTDVEEIDSLNPQLPLGCDTESQRDGTAYCLTYSQSAGTGRLIRAGRRDLLDWFNRRLQEWEADILWHNYFYDWTVADQLGLAFPYRQIVDTMAEVYRLGNLPQGLKALSYRELGMVMQDFDDLVTPYSRELVLNYYRYAQTTDWPKPEQRLEMDDKTGLWKLKKPQGMNTKFKRFFTDYGKNPDKDVFLTWENWEAEQAMIEEEVGKPWPGKCISHVPFEEVLFYACRDADALIRLRPILLQMKARVRKYPQHEWRVQ